MKEKLPKITKEGILNEMLETYIRGKKYASLKDKTQLLVAIMKMSGLDKVGPNLKQNVEIVNTLGLKFHKEPKNDK